MNMIEEWRRKVAKIIGYDYEKQTAISELIESLIKEDKCEHNFGAYWYLKSLKLPDCMELKKNYPTCPFCPPEVKEELGGMSGSYICTSCGKSHKYICTEPLKEPTKEEISPPCEHEFKEFVCIHCKRQYDTDSHCYNPVKQPTNLEKLAERFLSKRKHLICGDTLDGGDAYGLAKVAIEFVKNIAEKVRDKWYVPSNHPSDLEGVAALNRFIDKLES